MASSDLKEQISVICATEVVFKYLLGSQREDHCLHFLKLSDSIFIAIKDHCISLCSFFLLGKLLGFPFFGSKCLKYQF